jgi:outer membrane lipoprotein-sorting protein
VPNGQSDVVAMRRRHLLVALGGVGVALSIFAPPGSAQSVAAAPLTDRDRADLARITSYLNGIHTLKARFLQVAPDGSTSQGVVWLDRPGRMRFQYDPPSPLLLVAGHGLVVFHDSQLNQTSNIPLSRTPLGILLADTVALTGDVTVIGLQRQQGQIQVTVVRTATPNEGTLTLVFVENPLTLRQWSVVDAQRRETRVTLYNAELGGKFDQSLFTFIDPRFFQNNNPP